MNYPAGDSSTAQLSMPGIPSPALPSANASRANVWPGQEVLYIGRLKGGPRFGVRGVVKETLGRRAVVDMGRWGIWRVPYYFLSVPHEPDREQISSL